jgi:hypothetical protein
MPGVNRGARKGEAVAASYKIPVVLLIYKVKKKKIRCRLRYGYFVTVNQIVMTTVCLFGFLFSNVFVLECQFSQGSSKER